jgi:lysophospholipase L1-like esterase
VTGRARLGLAVGAALALAAGSPAAAAPGLLSGTPALGGVVVQAPVAGEDAGHMVLDVGADHPAVAGGARGRVDLTTATHLGVVRVRLRAADGRALGSAGSREPLLLNGPGGRVHMVHRIVLGPSASAALRAAAAAGPVRARIVAQSRLIARGARRPVAVSTARRGLGLPPPSAWRARLEPRPRPVCDQAPERATAGRTALIALRCMGDDPRVALEAGPRRGTASIAERDPGLTLVRYRAPSPAGGSDRLAMRASSDAGVTVAALPIVVRPFTMRAIGDSVTAGFGYMGDGTPMGITQLPFCVPPTRLNDRCSSNSSNGPSSGGGAAWSSDTGYGNGVAWPAQFARANGIASSAFANRAVSGSTPADWLPGGQLNDALAGVVADDPDLTVLTLGANPLLDIFLVGRGIGCDFTLSEPAFSACVQRFITQQQLVPRLRAVIAQLLVAPGNRVVVSQYHQAIPASSVFSVASLRILGQVLNANVAQAVQGAPGFGSRVFLMSPPLFTVGVPPGDAVCVGERLGQGVDGPSVQSEAAQVELDITHPFSFCGSTDYWIISADTGVHPSVAGHAQFAASLQAVADQNALGPPGP